MSTTCSSSICGSWRALALREFAPGIEALQRFLRHEPLRRVNECVFGVLAPESEPVTVQRAIEIELRIAIGIPVHPLRVVPSFAMDPSRAGAPLGLIDNVIIIGVPQDEDAFAVRMIPP